VAGARAWRIRRGVRQWGAPPHPARLRRAPPARGPARCAAAGTSGSCYPGADCA